MSEIHSSEAQLPVTESRQGAGIGDRLRAFVGIKSKSPEANSFAAEATGLPVPLKRVQQPGENAELHPDDAAAIAELNASKLRQSEYATQAILSGASATHPVNEPRYPAPQTPAEAKE